MSKAAKSNQAGASSRIENYVGFPNGISGEELASRAAIQAQRLGARINAPCEVAGLRVEHGFHVVELADASEIPCRAVIVATGARYQRLAVAIKAVLERAIAHGGTTLRDYVGADGTPGYFRQKLFVYERAGEPCRVCQVP